MPRIVNCSREAAEVFVPDRVNWACISISQPGEVAELSSEFRAVLRMEFSDWDLDRYPDGTTNPAFMVLFDVKMADRIKRFAEFVRGMDILVHCDAGVSRSAAVAEVLLEVFPEYIDLGGYRHSNNYVRRLLRRAFNLVPSGVLLMP